MESRSRAALALPKPRESSSAPEIELSEVLFCNDTLLDEGDPSQSHQTWLTFLKRELEFLGVTQILIASIYLCFGTIVYTMLKISEFEKKFFSSFKAGYPFWGAVFVQGSLGANLVSSIAAGTGVMILVTNLKSSLACSQICQEAYEDEFCLAAFNSIEIVTMILFLTILGLGVAVLLIVYRIGELLKKDKVPEDRLYEELNIYSPIYSELEDRGEPSSPNDS
ncbi:high affinity immunoglobulin epsilon receptor subunit beta isoform X2 [Saccopteryx bilineata]|uniref:high affinity immunoglobulin epsilon receptor subunit beta isoform X2 n=1 Tax=Saccopteryx bilineata TaxID=59482 RepID=UPI00338EA0A3